MSAKRGPETTGCRNCGIEIRAAASVCHNCGAENDGRPERSVSIGHDPANIETTVSDFWYVGVITGVVLWFLSILLSGIVESFAGFLMIVGWIVLPLSAYFDMRYIRANSSWNPSLLLWTAGLAIPLLNILLGRLSLYYRHEWMGLPVEIVQIIGSD